MVGGSSMGWSTRNGSDQTWREIKRDKYVNKVYFKFLVGLCGGSQWTMAV